MASVQLAENVPRLDIDHVKPLGIENGVDVSAQNRTWRSYLWDTWDKSPEVGNFNGLFKMREVDIENLGT